MQFLILSINYKYLELPILFPFETDSTVRLFYIENDEVAKRTEALKALGPLPTIKGTMRIHQVVCLGTVRFEYRDISCVCSVKDKILNCGCFDPKKFETLNCIYSL